MLNVYVVIHASDLWKTEILTQTIKKKPFKAYGSHSQQQLSHTVFVRKIPKLQLHLQFKRVPINLMHFPNTKLQTGTFAYRN